MVEKMKMLLLLVSPTLAGVAVIALGKPHAGIRRKSGVCQPWCAGCQFGGDFGLSHHETEVNMF